MMHYYSLVTSGINARCDNKKRAFKAHGADLYEINGHTVLDFSAKSDEIGPAVEKSINLVKSEGGIVKQVWTQG